MRWLVIASVIALGFVGAAEAQEAKTVQCQKSADMRTVTMRSSADGRRVVYAKGKTPGRELWHYKVHPEKCEATAQQFMSKIQSTGLTCSAPS